MKDNVINRTQIKTEIIAGLTTFLTMMYIIVVNPTILSEAGLPYAGVETATVLVVALSSIIMGLYAKNPIAVAPGMGLNAFFTYTIVLQDKVPWQIALGVVFWSGMLFLILSLLNIRNIITNAIPKQLRYALACGIGLFITAIGLRQAGLVTLSHAAVTQFGHPNAEFWLFLVGLLTAAILLIRQFKAGFILSIIIVTLLAIPFGRLFGSETLVHWHGVFSWPSFSTFMQVNFRDSLRYALWPVIFTFAFTDIFGSVSTFVGVAEAGQLLTPTGEVKNLKRSMIATALASIFSGIFGSSSSTAYIESAAGVEVGGRTGLTAIVVGLLFLPFLFLGPLVSLIPTIATAPVLVLVGLFMMKPITKIHWHKMDDALPCFLAIIMIPLTNSITQGIIWGLLSWVIIKFSLRKFDDIHWILWILSAFCALLLYIEATAY